MNNNKNEIIYDNESKKVLITQIINFMKSDAGEYLKSMIVSTHKNRLNDLIYANKEDIFIVQGELRAYNDVIGFLDESSLETIRNIEE